MKVRELRDPVTATKAHWAVATTWMGFSPSENSTRAMAQCQSTIQRQFDGGYVLEYITKTLQKPNSGFENDPQYVKERQEHATRAGRLIAIHRLRQTARNLEQIIGSEEFRHLQDVWATPAKRVRWSVAFPIVESYRVVGTPLAETVFPRADYHRLYAVQGSKLRPLTDEHRSAIADLELEPVQARNAWIAIEDEFYSAERSEIDPNTFHCIARDLPDSALEGQTKERQTKIRTRAAWLADAFVLDRQRSGALFCDRCGFNPKEISELATLRARHFLDVHHKRPMDEGVRYTNKTDFMLLCPTCHRIEHALLKLQKTRSNSGAVCHTA